MCNGCYIFWYILQTKFWQTIHYGFLVIKQNFNFNKMEGSGPRCLLVFLETNTHFLYPLTLGAIHAWHTISENNWKLVPLTQPSNPVTWVSLVLDPTTQWLPVLFKWEGFRETIEQLYVLFALWFQAGHSAQWPRPTFVHTLKKQDHSQSNG